MNIQSSFHIPKTVYHLRVEHLQLHAGTILDLERMGIRNLGDLVRAWAKGFHHQDPEVENALQLLSACTGKADIDWRTYWSRVDEGPKHLFASSSELDELSVRFGSVSVNRQTLGNAGARLETYGVKTFSELIDQLRSGITGVPGLGQKRIRQFFQSLAVIIERARSSDNPDIVFRAYGSGNAVDCRLRALRRSPSPDELLSLRVSFGECSVNRTTFGNAGGMLERHGITTVDELVDLLERGERDVPGMGRKKWGELDTALAEIIDSGRFPEAEARSHAKVEVDALALRGKECCEHIDSLDIGVLHIGAKASSLREAGLGSVGALWRYLHSGKESPSGVGKRTLGAAAESILALAASVEGDGNISWERYCDQLHLKLIPTNARGFEPHDFLLALSSFLLEVAEAYEDSVVTDIVANRISQLPHHRSTLEQIAQAAPVKITRERVRQKEAKLLRQVTDALIFDDYGSFQFHFHPKFSEYWVRAANAFSHEDEEVDFDTFIQTLAEIWRVDPEGLVEHLPVVLALVTGEPSFPASFRDGAAIDPRLLSDLSSDAQNVPIERLLLGRAGRKFIEEGIGTVGQLIDGFRTGALSGSGRKHERDAFGHLEHIASSLNSSGRLDWSQYARSLGMEIRPHSEVASYSEFLSDLKGSVASLLEHLQVPGRSVEVFDRRSGESKENRSTIDALAAELGTHGPTIKRIETDLLQVLHSTLIDQDMTRAGVMVRESYLSRWQQVKELYDESGCEAGRFAEKLKRTWKVTDAEVRPALPVLLAILTGYPFGRRTRHIGVSKVSAPVAPPTQDGRVRLRGFRRIH